MGEPKRYSITIHDPDAKPPYLVRIAGPRATSREPDSESYEVTADAYGEGESPELAYDAAVEMFDRLDWEMKEEARQDHFAFAEACG